MTHRSICNLWILLAAVTLSQLWRGITGQVSSYSIEVVSSVRVQEGHNASIPCSFTADGRNTFSNSFGYWREPYSESIVASNDESRAGQKTNFKLTGNPDSGDCTLTITDARREDDTEYYFRFEESKNSKVKYSYKDKKKHIIVTGIKEKIVFSKGYSIEVNSSVSVQKGLSVSIPCKFTAADTNTFRNSFGYWRELYSESIVATNDESSAGQKTNFNLTGNPDSGDCTLTITDARTEDEGVYYFRFEESKDGKIKYNYYKEVTTTIKVTGLTEEPVISDFGTLIVGVKKTLTCAPPGNCPVKSFLWKKSNVAGIWTNLSTITFTPSIEDDQETITCEITNSRGDTTQKHIHLNVDLPLLKDPKVIAGLITGIIIVVSAILLGIVFLVRRKKKAEPSSLNNHPSNSKTASEEMYANIPRTRNSNRTCVAMEDVHRSDNIYMNIEN